MQVQYQLRADIVFVQYQLRAGFVFVLYQLRAGVDRAMCGRTVTVHVDLGRTVTVKYLMFMWRLLGA